MKLAVDISQIVLALAACSGLVPLYRWALKRHRKRVNDKWLDAVVPAVTMSVLLAVILLGKRSGE